MPGNKYKGRKGKQQSPSVCRHAEPGPEKATWQPLPGKPWPRIQFALIHNGPFAIRIPSLPQLIICDPTTEDADWYGEIDFDDGWTGYITIELSAESGELEALLHIEKPDHEELEWKAEDFAKLLDSVQVQTLFYFKPINAAAGQEVLTARASRY